ncbi:TP53RK-binding protein [Apostichopus japonicus]|uniref:TP53RK-binding protein n=1 Tax=Stichopus japonicus TaxID=307972 RepID=A0A2G8LCS3_STIJA|nr:TP53RK-binding protein [Apostichopus japonicus]
MASCDHVRTFPVDLFPNSTISIALFDGIKNHDELKKKIISGKIDAALLSAKKICDIFQVLVAATKAVGAKSNGKLKTRSINSEVLFSLSPSNNITESLRTFGVSPSDSAVVAVTIDDFDGLKIQNVAQQINAEMKPLDQLNRYTDEDIIKKVYKISDAELKHSKLLDSVATRIAVKEFAT